jgi:hypothetical protein
MSERPKRGPNSGEDGAAREKIAEGPEGMRRMQDLLRRILKVPKDKIQEVAGGRGR